MVKKEFGSLQVLEYTEANVDVRDGIQKLGVLYKEYNLSRSVILSSIIKEVERAFDVTLEEKLIKRGN